MVPKNLTVRFTWSRGGLGKVTGGGGGGGGQGALRKLTFNSSCNNQQPHVLTGDQHNQLNRQTLRKSH